MSQIITTHPELVVDRHLGGPLARSALARDWAAGLAGSGSRELVLAVVEDERARLDVEAALEPTGLRVIALRSAATALSVVADMFVDCLVAQHPLREIESATLCLGARRARGRWRPGFVALADSTVPLPAADRALYDAIATRPVCATDLVGAVRRALARRRSSAHAHREGAS
jgi:DNA-binding NtrC family response regulator